MKALIKGILLAVFLLFIYNLYSKYTNTKSVFLGNTYEQENKLYTLKFPDNWIYTNQDDGSVIFSGPKGSYSFFTLVKIERLTAASLGTNKVSTVDLVRSFTDQVSTRGKVLSFGNTSLPSDPKHFKGMHVTATYPYNGKTFKKTQYFIARDGSQTVYYLWSYTAVEEFYDRSLPIINAMFDSWVIRGD